MNRLSARWSQPVVDAAATPPDTDSAALQRTDDVRASLLTWLGIVEFVLALFVVVTTVTNAVHPDPKAAQLFNYLAGALYFAGVALTITYIVINQRQPYTTLARPEAVFRRAVVAVAWCWFALAPAAVIVCIPVFIVAVLASIWLPHGVAFIVSGWIALAIAALVNAWLLHEIYDHQAGAPAYVPAARILASAALVVALVGTIPMVFIVWTLGVA